jgi:hypothetical protein
MGDLAIGSEKALLATAKALVKGLRLTPAEQKVLRNLPSVSAGLVRAVHDDILAGGDPLGEAFSNIRSADDRRCRGQTFTPPAIVQCMVASAVADAAVNGPFTRVVDGGLGSGRYLRRAAVAFPDAILVGVELDPVCALLARATFHVLGLTGRLHLVVGDFRAVDLPKALGRTLWIGNPPYVRHHALGEQWKDWYAATMNDLGAPKASKLAGLHLHFFARVGEAAGNRDLGILITAAEWTDTNYGAALRTTLCGKLGGVSVHVVDAKAEPFPGVMTTAAITVFKPGQRQAAIRLQVVVDIGELGCLESGIARTVDELSSAKKWQVQVAAPSNPAVHNQTGTRVGSIFRVSRGQVTGANHAWIAGQQAKRLPKRFLLPCITGAKELFTAFEAGGRLESADHLDRVVDLPRDLSGLSRAERAEVDAFLKWAKSVDADKGYVASHRSAWWAIRLPAAAPIVCTYMARRAPVFVRNMVDARLLNIAHGLYPLIPMSDVELDEVCRSLNRASNLNDGRVYAGGLTKFEPSAVEDMLIDWTPSTLLEAAE